MSVLERAIRAVAPGYALRRATARAQIDAMQRAHELARGYYDGADLGRRGASIRRYTASANTVSRATLPSLRAGSRDLIRNNPYANRAQQIVQNNVSGPGIKMTFRQADGEPAQAIQEFAQPYLEGVQIDADGLHTYYGLQDLAVAGMFSGGEVLAIRQITREGFHIRLIEGDQLDHTRDSIGWTGDGTRTIQGVHVDRGGRRLGYWIYPDHPGETRLGLHSQYVDAADVAHVYRVDRPGQMRGIPWLSPVLLRLQDFADYEEAQLVRQKIAACFAVFVSDPTSSALPSNSGQHALPEDLEPGMIQQLNPGAQVNMTDPPSVSDYGEYAAVSIRAIAVGAGVPYTALSENLAGVSWSAGRMGGIEFKRNKLRWTWHTMVPRFCDRVAGWILEEAELRGLDTTGVRAQHTPPAMEMIDPGRERASNAVAMRTGQATLSQIAQESGRDVRTLMQEMRKDFDLLDQFGIVLDSDPRRTTGAGILQAGTEPPDETED